MSTRSDQRKDAAEHGLYDPAYEHDACGVGFVASVKGQASHEIVTQALQILKNLDHRGAVGADPLCGDGAGILIQIPDAFFRAEMAKQNILLPPAGDYGVGMIFLPREHAFSARLRTGIGTRREGRRPSCFRLERRSG